MAKKTEKTIPTLQAECTRGGEKQSEEAWMAPVEERRQVPIPKNVSTSKKE